ncbi:hypothetical protein ACOMHN_045736 [Nucella lapillus]
MEGPVYVCDYLGYKTLNKPATSIAGLQTTVRELYLQFRKNLQQGGPPKKSSFKVTPGGLLVSLHESGNPLEMFFDITCINLIQSVRFALLKGSEKKPKAVFVPIDDTRARVNVEKSAFSLDKSFHFLVHASHNPLLVCVLRRPKGVKALDCHVFGMDSPENVLYVQSCVNQLMTSGGSAAGEAAFNRSGTRGDFIRTEFGDYSVYRGGQGSAPAQGQKFELKDEHFRGGDGGGGGGGEGGGFPPDSGPGPRDGGQPSSRETYPADSGDRPRFGWSYDKPQSGEDFRRISGQFGGEGGRPVSGELRSGNQPPGDASRQGNQFPGDASRQGNQFLGDGGRQGNQFYQDGRSGSQYQGDRRSGEMTEDRSSFRGGSGYTQGYRRPEYDRAEISHGRERSGDSGDSRLTGGNRKISATSDLSAGGTRGVDCADPRYGPPVSPRGEAPPRVMQKPVSPVRPAPGPAFTPIGGHAPLSPRVGAESPRSPASPFPPPGPPLNAGGGSFKEGPAFSLSNRESRADEVDQDAPPHGKPVAKVPPHLKGVKVLPSDFLAVKLKPKQQRTESEESDHCYDNPQNILAQYQQLQIQEQDAQEGFKGFDDPSADKLGKSRSYTSNWNDDGRMSSESGSGFDSQYRRYAGGEEERRYIEQYSDQDTVQVRPHGRYEESPAAGVGKNRPSGHGYRNNDAGSSSSGDWRSKTAYDMGPGQGAYPRGGGGGGGGMAPPSSAANDEKQLDRKKDAEIASMFSNHHGQGRSGLHPDSNNFEQSLGYLP